jgi:hypothetical protein
MATGEVSRGKRRRSMMKLIHMEALSWSYSSPSTTWRWSVGKPSGGVV